MKITKSFFSALIVVAFAATSFASVPTNYSSTDTKALTEIQSLVKKINFDFESLESQSIKVHFLVNTSNEIVVLKTSNDKLDRIVKANLNYKSLDNRDLEVNKVYILPITIQADGTNG